MGNSEHRNAQFETLFAYRDSFLAQGWPVLSIDTKKKELLGNFFRPGQAWTDGRPTAWDHDFPSSSWGKVIPYGVYDLSHNEVLMYLAQGTDTDACLSMRSSLVVSTWQMELRLRYADFVTGRLRWKQRVSCDSVS